jgi:hypothetical protein
VLEKVGEAWGTLPFLTYAYVRECAGRPLRRLCGAGGRNLGHRDRHEPLRAYVTGLSVPGERKSVEPLAARVDPRHVRSRHQSMHHFVADAPSDAAAMLRLARDWVLGKQDNCQVAVSVSVANDAVSLAVCWRGGSRWSTGSLLRSATIGLSEVTIQHEEIRQASRALRAAHRRQEYASCRRRHRARPAATPSRSVPS